MIRCHGSGLPSPWSHRTCTGVPSGTAGTSYRSRRQKCSVQDVGRHHVPSHRDDIGSDGPRRPPASPTRAAGAWGRGPGPGVAPPRPPPRRPPLHPPVPNPGRGCAPRGYSRRRRSTPAVPGAPPRSSRARPRPPPNLGRRIQRGCGNCVAGAGSGNPCPTCPPTRK